MTTKRIPIDEIAYDAIKNAKKKYKKNYSELISDGLEAISNSNGEPVNKAIIKGVMAVSAVANIYNIQDDKVIEILLSSIQDAQTKILQIAKQKGQ
jgi:hypothetical protein